MGHYEAIKYFDKEAKIKKLTWMVLIFNDVKGSKSARRMWTMTQYLCHLQICECEVWLFWRAQLKSN
jgi:hypothetical protein